MYHIIHLEGTHTENQMNDHTATANGATRLELEDQILLQSH